MYEPDPRKILTHGEAGGNDYDPLWGNVLHTDGKDLDADRAWVEMLQRQELEESQKVIAGERLRACKFGLEKEFDAYVAQGRFREFTPRLDHLQSEAERKTEKFVHLAAGAFIGFVVAAFLFSR